MDREFTLKVNGTDYKIEKHGNSLLVDGHPFVIGLEDGTLTVNGIAYDVILDNQQAVVDGKAYQIEAAGMATRTPATKKVPTKKKSAAGAGSVTAIMPGAILKVLVAAGDAVADGDVVIILEAMKMENEIHAHKTGTVKAVHVAVGDSVEKGEVLVEID